MKPVLILLSLAGLTACGDTKTETFFCANGPEFAVTYGDDFVTLTMGDGRVMTLPATDDPDTYAKDGVVWQDTEFRTGRLTDGPKGYNCDQSSY